MCIKSIVRVEATEKNWTDEPAMNRAKADVTRARIGWFAICHEVVYRAFFATCMFPLCVCGASDTLKLLGLEADNAVGKPGGC